MKILVIHGSMRKGRTYALTQEVMSRLSAKADVQFVEINVADLDLPFCVSCHVCFSKGEEFCPHAAHLQSLLTALKECDGVILSGTTYMWALNGAMKNLLDHLAFGFHRPFLFGKRGMVVATSKGNGEKEVAKYLRMVLGQWGVNGAVVVTQNAKEEQLLSPSKLAKRLDKAAERFYRQLSSKKPIPPSLRSIAVQNAFRSMALSEFSEFERDAEFWRKEENNRAYPVRIGVFRYAVGAAVFGAASFATHVIGRKIKGK